MALHEIHWDPHARALVLVRNHGIGPDNGCGWDGEEVRDIACPSCGVTCADHQPREVS